MARADQQSAQVLKGCDAQLKSAALSNNELAGSGGTPSYNGEIRRAFFKVSFAYTDFSAAALTKDLTIATLPAKARLLSFVADATVAFAGPAGTLQLKAGVSAGGGEVLAAADVKTAAVTLGLADADMGTGLTRAASIQGGYMPSWTAASTLQCRLTSSSGNLTGLTAGAVSFYVFYEQMA